MRPFSNKKAAFLICTECHMVKEASSQGLTHQLDQLAASDDFVAQHSIIDGLHAGGSKEYTH
jgi:Fur family zinc uptake transcriptional regulator